MTEVTGRIKESADGLRGRGGLREAISQAGSEAERRRLQAQLDAQKAQKEKRERGR